MSDKPKPVRWQKMSAGAVAFGTITYLAHQGIVDGGQWVMGATIFLGSFIGGNILEHYKEVASKKVG